MPDGKDCLTITIQGIVQGVGFRPFIYNLAREMQVRGFVSNTSDGVIIVAEGHDLAGFIERIRIGSPPLSRIDRVDITPAKPCAFPDFSIRESSDRSGFTLIPPDISVCDACLKELFNQNDRRYLYPFINCTNCGPRYSITKSVPYDRKNTTMQVFTMCEQCSSEYHEPGDRRFHAQPNACAVCGPRVSLLDRTGCTMDSQTPVAGAIALLKAGKILAVKGLGGFHIACDALNPDAVMRLREGKRKSNKPFALMSPDTASIREYCHVSRQEEKLLLCPQRPVVLLKKKQPAALPEAVAPKNQYLGFMLPYTPLHHLLFHYPLTPHSSLLTPHCFDALVMTSGNISEEPIIISNDEAIEKLACMVDGFLVHDRDIFMRVDDSVTILRSQKPEFRTQLDAGPPIIPDSSFSFIRRSRGYAPEPIPLMEEGPDVLGCGADMKNTFALARGKYAIVSQHIGDMENYETIQFFEETLNNLKAVYRAEPAAVVHDLHPQYLSSAWAVEHAGKMGLRTFGLQHHYAHIGSVMAEHGLKGKVIGVAFDGSGYGMDGTLWGGEFLIADAGGFTRAGHLKQVPLPGSEMAIKEPWRIALSYMREAYGGDVMDYLGPTGFIVRYGEKKIADILQIAGNRAFSPLSSGAGRLFDAVSALLGICDLNTFEGEASVALESCVSDGIDDEYLLDIHFGNAVEVDFSHAIMGIVDDLQRKVDTGVIAGKFHNTVATAVFRVVIKLSMMNNIDIVCLSGGVFQNLCLFEKVATRLRHEGLAVYANEMVPCNDAGISLGQVYLAREMMKAGSLT